eukprot:augustus_masked-scaffold_10-processed-gene-10.57-mRNA-1 protein AED:0.15 eAED:1.00 QI:0/-1/0/1/-1/1/1/0/310
MSEIEQREKLGKLFHGIFSADSVEYGRSFKPRSDDIIVCTAPKVGTTWTLNICHMLRSKGDTNFEDLLIETPWDVVSKACGIDLDADHEYAPRVFKSHELYENVGKGAKYIFVTRDPYDAFVSYYHHMMELPLVRNEDISLELFADVFFTKGGFFAFAPDHIVSYGKLFEEKPENILVLFYEDLKENSRREIEKIARFMGFDDEPAKEFKERCDLAEKFSSYEYMKKKKEVYGGEVTNKRMFKPPPGMPKHLELGALNIVRKGTTGQGQDLPQVVKKHIQAYWERTVEAKYGYKTYDEFRKNFLNNFGKL